MSITRKGIRAGTRIPMELPVSMRWKSSSGVERRAQAKTGNISGNGLFILTPLHLRHNTQIQLTVLFPAEATKVPTRLRCEGRVVRQQARAAVAGIGVVIDDYDLLSSPSRE
jgi:PilZ domain